MRLFLYLFPGFFFLESTSANLVAGLAIDTSANLSLSSFYCLADTVLDTMFFGRVYSADGQVDEVGIGNMRNAYYQAYMGMNGYFQPCLKACKNGVLTAEGQVNTAITRLKKELTDTFLVVDVTNPANWSPNKTQNQQFLMNTVMAINRTNGGVGLYTSQSAWNSIVGANYNAIAPLINFFWWVNWNGVQPQMHQFAGNILNYQCTTGFSVDLSYFEYNTANAGKFSKNGPNFSRSTAKS